MNQFIQFILILGVVGSFTVGIGYYAENNIQDNILSQHDKIEINKKYTAENIKLIEVLDSPLRIDVVNIGIEKIIIKKLFVDGMLDDSFRIDGIVTKEIQQNQVTTIEPSIDGSIVKIITENNKLFTFS